jgi:hypothetical protein
VDVRRDGKRRLYIINPDALESLEQFLADLWPAGLKRLKEVVHYLSPVIGSLVVLRFADIDRLAQRSAGRYVLQHMPPWMVAIRLAGDTVTVIGAWQRRPVYLALGVLSVVIGWSHGLLTRG